MNSDAEKNGCDVQGEFNGDGVVDIGDFGVLVNVYGQSGALPGEDTRY